MAIPSRSSRGRVDRHCPLQWALTPTLVCRGLFCPLSPCSCEGVRRVPSVFNLIGESTAGGTGAMRRVSSGKHQQDSALHSTRVESETLEHPDRAPSQSPNPRGRGNLGIIPTPFSLLPPTPSQSPRLLISFSASISVPLEFILLTHTKIQNISLIMSLSGFEIRQ